VGRKAAIFGKDSGNKPKSGRLDGSLVDQHDRESVSHWVYAMALVALEGFGICFSFQRFVTNRACEKLEQIIRDHSEGILRRGELLLFSLLSPQRHRERANESLRAHNHPRISLAV